MTKPKNHIWKKVTTIPDGEYELTLQTRNLGGKKQYSFIVLDTKTRTTIQTRLSSTPEAAAVNAYRSIK